MDKEQQQAIVKRIERAIASYEDFSSTTREELLFLYRECQTIEIYGESGKEANMYFHWEFSHTIEAFKYLLDYNPDIESFSTEEMERLDGIFKQLGSFSGDAVSTPQLSKAIMSFDIPPNSKFCYVTGTDGFAVINETINNNTIISNIEIFCEADTNDQLKVNFTNLPIYNRGRGDYWSVVITPDQNSKTYLYDTLEKHKPITNVTKLAGCTYLIEEKRQHLWRVWTTNIVIPKEALQKREFRDSFSFKTQITDYTYHPGGLLSASKTTKEMRHTINFKVTNFGVGQ